MCRNGELILLGILVVVVVDFVMKMKVFNGSSWSCNCLWAVVEVDIELV